MTFCAVCQADVHPYTELRIGGPVTKCPRCRGGLVAESADSVTTRIDEASNETPPSPNVPVFVEPTPRPIVKPSSSVDVLTLAKERLAVVDGLIENLRAYEVEQALLRRMIEAAEPTAPVIALRAKQG
jgi:hypothetical protein